jgi:hypothetical protein
VIVSHDVREAVALVIDEVGSSARGILIRNPPLDVRLRDASDLDFLILADIDDMRVERLRVPLRLGLHNLIDLTWLPWHWVSNPESAAALGWIPHRLLSSVVVWESDGSTSEYCRMVHENMYLPEIQRKRIGVFLDTGFETVREIGVTWDFPPLALFWLHMGFAACLAAVLDGLERLCPNAFTRPLDYLDDIDRQVLPGARTQWMEALHLDSDPVLMAAALTRIHSRIVSEFAEPVWPNCMRSGTRFEYRYWLSKKEIEWRLHVADEMIRAGDIPSAVFYLRFCAYAAARIPMVHLCACEGRNTSFLRPERAVFPQLKRLVPEILDDLQFIFSGLSDLEALSIDDSLNSLIRFRDLGLDCLKARGILTPPLAEWEPYEPQA